eukprot:augustus_masked-scaffold_20-processed-gene-4.4-mRNA-1 protein AED:0.03 eAED:0.03 QI:0/-1/0/1/-1/1/1/0/355
MKRILAEAKTAQKFRTPDWKDEIRNKSSQQQDEEAENIENSESSASESDSDSDESSVDETPLKPKTIPTDEEILKQRKQNEDEIRNKIPYINKQRTLLFCSRGTNSLARHLIEDLRSLFVNTRKEAKHDLNKNLYEINELCEIRGCNNCIFFESKRHNKIRDLYMWISKCPTGPSVRFLVSNISTMNELRLTGNCMKGSRPILSFSKQFSDEKQPHLQLIKNLFEDTFGVPRGHPKSKPFTDHVFSFSLVENRIWFRNFQIVETDKTETPFELVEIGPRFVLSLDKVFAKGFGGDVLYENPGYVKPVVQRREEKTKLMQKRKYDEGYEKKVRKSEAREQRRNKFARKDNPLRGVF